MYAGIPMKEFLLWSNCPNNCQFCWQKKLNKPETLLTEEEMIDSIDAVISEINVLDYTDILIVGGEVYGPHSSEVNAKLGQLFTLIADRIRNGQTRYMYANTNLLYTDLANIDALMTAFEGIRDKLRLTTSFDIVGRFGSEEDKSLFLSNLGRMYADYGVSPCVNIILTAPMCEAIVNGTFNVSEFSNTNHLAFVNPIPYIPLDQNDILKATWAQIERTIYTIENSEPHFIQFYIDQMTMHVDRVLKEYRKGEGYVRCDSQEGDCGHNINYTRIFDNGECFVCKLRNIFDFPIASEAVIRDAYNEGKKIITVGDRCSYEVWTHVAQPNVMIIDGRDGAIEYSDALKKVRSEGLERILSQNQPEYPENNTLDKIGRMHLPNLTSQDHMVIHVIGEEDDALYTCIRFAPANTLIVFGDGDNECMRFKEITENDLQGKDNFEKE